MRLLILDGEYSIAKATFKVTKVFHFRGLFRFRSAKMRFCRLKRKRSLQYVPFSVIGINFFKCSNQKRFCAYISRRCNNDCYSDPGAVVDLETSLLALDR